MSNARAEAMAALYLSGKTLQVIGDVYGLTRERVRQILRAHTTVLAVNGGAAVRAKRKREDFEARRDQRALKKWGCAWDQYIAIRDLRKPTRAYKNQHCAARARGIGWNLTLWEWWSIWQASGHWKDRGLHHGQYVMCRKGDVGPYEVGNVFIALSVENISTGNRKKNTGLPIGVQRTGSGKFMAHRFIDRKNVYLGVYATPELAYAAYLMAGQPQAQAA